MFLFTIFNDSFIKQARSDSLSLSHSFDNNYCIIDLRDETIRFSLFIVMHKSNYKFYQINFYANSCNFLFYLINQHSMINKYISFEHILYVGKEIYKADLSKTLCQKYIQL